MSGILTISLDFELHWGGFEKWLLEGNSRQEAVGSEGKSRQLAVGSRQVYDEYFLNTREVIPEMLRLFQEHDVHVTWAAVGLLFHQSKAELLNNAPELTPTYQQKNLSAYDYIETIGIGEDEKSDPFHFAPSLIRNILSTPHQELGTHTYAHYYCNEDGQTVEQFREDLRAAQRVAKNYDVTLKSLVFPRNQFNDDYLKVCFDEGITSVRSNPMDWFWQIGSTEDESKWKRLNRGLDAYFPVGGKNTFTLSSLGLREGYPLCLPASRLLRPYRPSELFLNDFKINRIKSEMTRAARNGEVYHLWWHPHNFGSYPEQSLKALKMILNHFDDCRLKWKMQSMNMREISSSVFHN